MKLLRADEARSVPVRANVHFSARSALVGAAVVVGYAALIVFLWWKTTVPVPAIAINLPLWLFFFWYWQRNLRRVVLGDRPFSLAVTDRALVFPLNHPDKAIPVELDRYVEVRAIDVKDSVFLDVRTVRWVKRQGRRHLQTTRTAKLRLHLKVPVADEVRAALAQVTGRSGFLVVHVDIPSDDVIELYFHHSQVAAVERVLVAVDPRLKPARVTRTDDLRNEPTESSTADLRRRVGAERVPAPTSVERDRERAH